MERKISGGADVVKILEIESRIEQRKREMRNEVMMDLLSAQMKRLLEENKGEYMDFVIVPFDVTKNSKINLWEK